MNTRSSFLLASFLFAIFPAWCAEPANLCQPSPELAAAFEKAAAASAAVTEPFAALDRAAPFLAVRDQFPDNLFAHERYQDAIHENGIEGHMQLLDKQYTQLESKHQGDPMYRYLRLRAIAGRSTPSVIRGMNELLDKHPDFFPAHQTLAEIYGTEAFRQPEKEQAEREKYLAACPGGTFTKRPPSIPPEPTLLEQAEKMLADGSKDPNEIVEVIFQGLREWNWRTQRIRAFDWYSRDFKVQDTTNLRLKYWQAWPTQTRCYLKAGKRKMADALIERMDTALNALHLIAVGQPYWNAIYNLAELYSETGDSEHANQKLDQLQRLAADSSDPEQKKLWTAQYEKLRATITQASAPSISPSPAPQQ